MDSCLLRESLDPAQVASSREIMGCSSPGDDVT